MLALLPLGVPPPAVVVAGTGVGLLAAVELGRGELLLAAILLQLKTLLDNADGQLARASGRVTAFGRYLDSESDLLVNAALFVALGSVTGEALLAGVCFVLVTLVLSIDFNLELLYRRERGETVDRTAGGDGGDGGARADLRRRLRAAGPARRLVRRAPPPRGEQGAAARLPRPGDADGRRELRLLDAVPRPRDLPRARPPRGLPVGRRRLRALARSARVGGASGVPARSMELSDGDSPSPRATSPTT